MIENETADNSSGVVYLAFGYEYCIEAVRSACSLKSVHPEVPISILTNVRLNSNLGEQIVYNDTKVGPELFDEVIHIDDDSETNRQYKTSINEYTPYDRTLYLDCDTVVKREITQGFRFLDYVDLAAVVRPLPSPWMVEKWDGDINVDNIDIRDSPTFYSGVLFFDADGASEFFEQWHRTYNRFGYDFDQYSMAHAIYTTDIRFLPLPITWNTMDTAVEKFKGFDNEYDFEEEMKIHHQNFPSYGKMSELREIESKIGDDLLSDNEEQKNEIRAEFQKEYSRWNSFKTEAEKYRILKLLYKFVFTDIPLVK